MRWNASLLTICLVGSSALSTGCSSLNNKTSKESGKSIWSPSTWFEEEYQAPSSLAVIWSPDVLAVQGQESVRGFGGRVFFYNDRLQAVPVEGDLVIHGYDQSKTNRGSDSSTAADKTFNFSAEQLTTHFSPSELGASYSIWVPWDQAGGLRQPVSLVATFKSVDGKITQGTPAKLFLPGKTVDPNEETLPRMQAVSYQSSSMPTNMGIVQKAASGVRTTTITVPEQSSLTRRSNGKFTLGGPTRTSSNGLPLSVESGAASSDSAGQSSVEVGGGARPGQAEPSAKKMPPNTAGRATTQLQIGGLPQPPTHPVMAAASSTTARPSQPSVVPASYQSN